MLVGVLETLDEAENLINVSSDGQVVDAHLTEDTLSVNNVGSAHGDASILTLLNEALVGASDALGDIRHHGDAHLSETASSSGL